jgi:hypothetical protein
MLVDEKSPFHSKSPGRPVRIHVWILADYLEDDTCIKLSHHNAKTLQKPFSFVNILDISDDAVKIVNSLAETEDGFQNDFSGTLFQIAPPPALR